MILHIKKDKIMKMLSNNLTILRLIKKNSEKYILKRILYQINDIIRTFISIYSLKLIIDLISRKDMKNSIIAIILIQIINLICQEINTLLKGYYLYKDEQLIQKNIKAEIYRKIAAVDLLKYEDTEFYNNYSRVIKQMGGSRIFETLDIFIDYFGKLVFSISFMTIIFTIDIYLLCFSLLFVIIGLFNSVKSSNISYKMYIETTNTDREEKYIDKLFYQKNFAEEIRFFNLAEWLLEKFNAIFVKRYMLIMKYKKKATILYAVSMIIETVIRIFLYLYIIYLAIINRISIGDYTLLTTMISNLAKQIEGLVIIFPKLYENSLYINDYEKMINMKKNIETTERSKNKIHIKRIELKNVFFQYPGRNEYALKNICLNMENNCNIAIVGRNGAGKTTLIKLLMKLYIPEKGIIEVNGININNINVNEYRNNISVVFQNSNVYSFTIRENIIMNNEYTKYGENIDTNIIKLLDEMEIYNKIRNFKNGLYTNITREFDEYGVNFSGGENQKLIIARALFRDSRVLILDEPFNSLDVITENEIYNKILKNKGNKIVIFISHRLYSCKDADFIIYMDDGEIKEVGTHNDLLNRNMEYAEMYKMQANKFMGNASDV